MTSGSTAPLRSGAVTQTNHGEGERTVENGNRQRGRRRRTQPPAPRMHAFASAIPATAQSACPATPVGHGPIYQQRRRPKAGRWARSTMPAAPRGAISHHETNLSDGSGPARPARCRQTSRQSFDECEFEHVVSGACRRGCTRWAPPGASGSTLTPGASLGDHPRPAAAAAESPRTGADLHPAPGAKP